MTFGVIGQPHGSHYHSSEWAREFKGKVHTKMLILTLTLMLFHTCMNFGLLWNTTVDITKKVSVHIQYMEIRMRFCLQGICFGGRSFSVWKDKKIIFYNKIKISK